MPGGSTDSDDLQFLQYLELVRIFQARKEKHKRKKRVTRSNKRTNMDEQNNLDQGLPSLVRSVPSQCLCSSLRDIPSVEDFSLSSVCLLWG